MHPKISWIFQATRKQGPLPESQTVPEHSNPQITKQIELNVETQPLPIPAGETKSDAAFSGVRVASCVEARRNAEGTFPSSGHTKNT